MDADEFLPILTLFTILGVKPGETRRLFWAIRPGNDAECVKTKKSAQADFDKDKAAQLH